MAFSSTEVKIASAYIGKCGYTGIQSVDNATDPAAHMTRDPCYWLRGWRLATAIAEHCAAPPQPQDLNFFIYLNSEFFWHISSLISGRHPQISTAAWADSRAPANMDLNQ